VNGPPEPPPEGAVIEAARAAARLSVREAARRAGISEGWWRQVAPGYQTLSGGAHGDVRAPAETIARMARAAGAVPADLEGCRPDAAAILAGMLKAEQAPRPAPAPDEAVRAALYAALDAVNAPLREQVLAEAKAGPFTDPVERAIWESSPEFTPEERAREIAGYRARRAGGAGRRAAG
jgi:transcriptional regulator with XRE-family HTH domain